MDRSSLPVALFLLMSAPAILGCDKKPTPSPAAAAPANPAPTASAAKPTPVKVDWSKVTATDDVHSVEAVSHLCRLLDIRHKGASPVTLTFTGSAATDPGGATYPVSPAEWKGIVALTAKSPDGTTAGRAAPAAAYNHHDGLGQARRYAYYIKRTSDTTLTFTVAKPLDDNSNG